MSNTSATTCANCGKGEEAGINNLKSCTACMLVKYCNRDCQIAHRPQHKKACKKRAKELHDEKLFEQPPPMEDCPICFQRLPYLDSGQAYQSCCGKNLCTGCIYGFQSRVTKEEHDICPFCRAPTPKTDEEIVKRLEKRMELNDAQAMYNLGCFYCNGSLGLPRDHAKALELWHRAAELGDADAVCNVANAYRVGRGVEVDEKKAEHYAELAAIEGESKARYNLGVVELHADNYNRALKHFMIAARDGYSNSLEGIKLMYENGDATKDDYSKALRSYQAYLDDIKSDQRDEAAAFNDEYKYCESAS
jgi:tetratricopeptide (TPR) repeat protein